MLIKLRKAQSTVEYGILIGVIVAAAVAMQTYVKRSIQAKQKDAADMVTGVAGNFTISGSWANAPTVTATMGSTAQYEPYYLSRHQETQTSEDKLKKNVYAGGRASTTKNQAQQTKSLVVYRYDGNVTP